MAQSLTKPQARAVFWLFDGAVRHVRGWTEGDPTRATMRVLAQLGIASLHKAPDGLRREPGYRLTEFGRQVRQALAARPQQIAA